MFVIGKTILFFIEQTIINDKLFFVNYSICFNSLYKCVIIHPNMLLKRFYIFVYITYRGKSSVPEPAPLKNKLLVNMYYTLLEASS